MLLWILVMEATQSNADNAVKARENDFNIVLGEAVLRTQYLGCYEDVADVAASRDSPTFGGIGNIAECATLCEGYEYFGHQSTLECWCGSEYGRFGTSEDCACDDPTDVGVAVNCVYKIEKVYERSKNKVDSTQHKRLRTATERVHKPELYNSEDPRANAEVAAYASGFTVSALICFCCGAVVLRWLVKRYACRSCRVKPDDNDEAKVKWEVSHSQVEEFVSKKEGRAQGVQDQWDGVHNLHAVIPVADAVHDPSSCSGSAFVSIKPIYADGVIQNVEAEHFVAKEGEQAWGMEECDSSHQSKAVIPENDAVIEPSSASDAAFSSVVPIYADRVIHQVEVDSLAISKEEEKEEEKEKEVPEVEVPDVEESGTLDVEIAAVPPEADDLSAPPALPLERDFPTVKVDNFFESEKEDKALPAKEWDRAAKEVPGASSTETDAAWAATKTPPLTPIAPTCAPIVADEDDFGVEVINLFESEEEDKALAAEEWDSISHDVPTASSPGTDAFCEPTSSSQTPQPLAYTPIIPIRAPVLVDDEDIQVEVYDAPGSKKEEEVRGEAELDAVEDDFVRTLSHPHVVPEADEVVAPPKAPPAMLELVSPPLLLWLTVTISDRQGNVVQMEAAPQNCASKLNIQSKSTSSSLGVDLSFQRADGVELDVHFDRKFLGFRHRRAEAVVREVIPGCDAAMFGVRLGMEIVRVDGKDVTGRRFEEIRNWIVRGVGAHFEGSKSPEQERRSAALKQPFKVVFCATDGTQVTYVFHRQFIGFRIAKGNPVVTDVAAGSQASDAGVKEGMKLVRLGGQSCSTMTFEEIEVKLREYAEGFVALPAASENAILVEEDL